MKGPSRKVPALLLAGLLAFVCCVGVASGKEYIDAMEHDIQIVTQQNFDQNIRKFRDDKVSAVLFYKKEAAAKKMIDGWYNKAAKDLKGMIKVAALDCDDSPVFCKQQNVKEYPSIVIYPPNPLPATPYEGEMTEAAFKSHVTKFIPGSNVKKIAKADIDTFLSSDVAIPKVLLFTDKKGVPTLYKALSSSFKKEMKFGLVVKEEADLVSRFKIKTFPTIQVHRAEQKPKNYSGEMKYQQLSDWLNVFVETFVAGGGFHEDGPGTSSGGGENAKPWLVQRIPEVIKASHGDLCFKKDDKGLCVIYLREGPLENAEEEMLEGLKEKFTSNLADRGTTFRWMWMDMGVEAAWKEMFNPEMLPSVVVFNPYKRLRYCPLEGKTATEASVSDLIDKILGGDGRFKMVPGQKLPEFAKRDKEGKVKPSKEEL
mmetsp:Transcript_14165/g.28388  ORF Transcript_14165/g.28388 Transcript_14165/m.28388 type:complete len:427 (-) Transcript_14165:473-1753(-)